MHEEVLALEAQKQNLQSLVGELLRTNQQLRLELAQKKGEAVSEPATHPPPRQDR